MTVGHLKLWSNARVLVDFFPGVWSLGPADFSVCLLVWGAEADVELRGFLDPSLRGFGVGFRL